MKIEELGNNSAFAAYKFFSMLTEVKEEIDFDIPAVDDLYNTTLINRVIGQCEMLIPVAAELVKYDLPKDVHAKFLMTVLPQRRIWSDKLKRKKDESTRSHDVRVLADYYECSLTDAKHYHSVLSDKQIADVVKMYIYGNGKEVEI